MKWSQAKEQLLNDRATKEAYESIDLCFEIGKMITDARIAKNMTQSTLAKKVGTKQPSIARIESGNSLPSLRFLDKIAEALGTRLLPPRFELFVSNKTIDVRQLYTYEASTAQLSSLKIISASHTKTTMIKEYNPLIGGHQYAQVTC